MRALISLVLGTLMLNLSVHAGSPSRSSSPASDAAETHDEDLETKKNNHAWEKQEMEESSRELGTKSGFEKQPNQYHPRSSARERIQTNQ